MAANVIYTYDRKIIKLHKDRVAAANESTQAGDAGNSVVYKADQAN